MTSPIVIPQAPLDICRRVRAYFESPAYRRGRFSDLRDSQRPLAHFLELPGHDPYSTGDESPKLTGLYVWDVMERIGEAPKVTPRTIVNNLRAFLNHKLAFPIYSERFLTRVNGEQPYMVGELGLLINEILKTSIDVGLSTYWMFRTQKAKDELAKELKALEVKK